MSKIYTYLAVAKWFKVEFSTGVFLIISQGFWESHNKYTNVSDI